MDDKSNQIEKQLSFKQNQMASPDIYFAAGCAGYSYCNKIPIW